MIRPKIKRNKLTPLQEKNITKYVLILSCLIMNISYSMYESMFIYELRNMSYTFIFHLFYRIILLYNFSINILLFMSLLDNESLHREKIFVFLKRLDICFLFCFGVFNSLKSFMILFFININVFYISHKV
jgi:hypothetical protein